ncbi:MAG: DUF4397 domain-containing protein, partial [Frankiaceae bacterium]
MGTIALGAAIALPSLPVGPAAAAPAGLALLRVAHLSPGAPALQVRVDGRTATAPVAFTKLSGYLRVPAGEHSVQLSGGQVNVTTRTNFAAGSAHTVAAMGIATKSLAKSFNDQLTAPAAGDGKVRVVHAAQGVPPADVVAQTGAVLFANVAFSQDPGYRAVPAGTYSVTMRRAGTSDILLAAKGIAVQAGTISSIWAVGSSGSALKLIRSNDAAGAGATPVGGMNTGFGGTAPGQPTPGQPTPVWPGLLGGLAVMAAGG